MKMQITPYHTIPSTDDPEENDLCKHCEQGENVTISTFPIALSTLHFTENTFANTLVLDVVCFGV